MADCLYELHFKLNRKESINSIQDVVKKISKNERYKYLKFKYSRAKYDLEYEEGYSNLICFKEYEGNLYADNEAWCSIEYYSGNKEYECKYFSITGINNAGTYLLNYFHNELLIYISTELMLKDMFESSILAYDSVKSIYELFYCIDNNKLDELYGDGIRKIMSFSIINKDII